jgi:hypothetical protein
VQLRRSGWTIKAPRRLTEEMGNLSAEAKNRSMWKDCLVEIYEIALVGAGIGGGFDHSSKLNVCAEVQSGNVEQ